LKSSAEPVVWVRPLWPHLDISILASCGQKVLLITIDPAKRLKELLGLSEEQAGDVQSVSLDYDGKTIEFDALLMSLIKLLNPWPTKVELSL
jgi:hypothetical protein